MTEVAEVLIVAGQPGQGEAAARSIKDRGSKAQALAQVASGLAGRSRWADVAGQEVEDPRAPVRRPGTGASARAGSSPGGSRSSRWSRLPGPDVHPARLG